MSFRKIMVVLPLLLSWAGPGMTQFIEKPTDTSTGSVLEFQPLQAAPRSLSQLIYLTETAQLERLTFELVAPQLVGGLDVFWQPSGSDVTSGPLRGDGRLVWRTQGTPAYDPRGVVAVFHGTFVDGRAEGQGSFWHRDGTMYDGSWRHGAMDGAGQMQWPNGTTYNGMFQDGLMDGAGQLVDRSGTIFRGEFTDGKHDGLIQVTPFAAPSYQAVWRSGREVPGTRVEDLSDWTGPSLHLVQTTSLPDARMGIALDPTPPPDATEWYKPFYRTENRGSDLVVFPADQAVYANWLGKGPLPVPNLDSNGWSGLDPSEHIPPSFDFSFENTGRRNLEIVGGYLAVSRSISYMRPVMNVFYEWDCGKPVISEFTFQNYGWSQPLDANVQVDVLDNSGNPIARTGGRLTADWPRPTVNLRSFLEQQGVAVARIEDENVLDCGTRSASKCLEVLRNSGLYGNLAAAVRIGNANVVGVTPIQVPVSVRLQYNWREADGSLHSGDRSFELPLKVGQLPYQLNTCAEGGMAEELFPNPFSLDLDRENYQIGFGLTATVPPGAQQNWTFQVDASRASFHDFQVVLILSDGREIASRPVKLEYMLSRSPFEDF